MSTGGDGPIIRRPVDLTTGTARDPFNTDTPTGVMARRANHYKPVVNIHVHTFCHNIFNVHSNSYELCSGLIGIEFQRIFLHLIRGLELLLRTRSQVKKSPPKKDH